MENCPGSVQESYSTSFDAVSEEILLNILMRLEDDSHDLACLACVCTRFSKLIRTTCWKSKCVRTFPTLVADLVQSSVSAEPPGGWASLLKLSICCPGLWHSGALFQSWDFGLHRELGHSEDYEIGRNRDLIRDDGSDVSLGYSHNNAESRDLIRGKESDIRLGFHHNNVEIRDLIGDKESDISLGFRHNNTGSRDLIRDKESDVSLGFFHNNAESRDLIRDKGSDVSLGFHNSAESSNGNEAAEQIGHLGNSNASASSDCSDGETGKIIDSGIHLGNPKKKKKRWIVPADEEMDNIWQRVLTHSEKQHLATGGSPASLRREEGNKLLKNRFRGDSLYVWDSPGCGHVHPETARKYKVFRGVFKDFKHSHVRRNLKDLKAKKSNIWCAYCSCKSTWDMVATFCLKQSMEYFEDGEPAVRAYVCENGHVSGAWTDL